MAEERLADLEAALRVGRGVVLQTYPNLNVLACLRTLVGDVVAAGGNVVVLGDARSDREVEALRSEYAAFLEQAHLADPFQFGTAYIGTVSDFITVLRDPDHAHWINHVGLILVPCGEQILARPYVWELLAFTLRDRFHGQGTAAAPRTVVVLEPRHAAVSAIRDALPLYASDPSEARSPWSGTTATPHTATQLWWTLWTTESSLGYFQNLEQINDRHYAGVAPPLAQFAGRWGVAAKDNWLLYSPDSGDVDHAENLERSLGRRLFNAIPDQPWASLPESAAHVGAVTSAEDQGNPWRSLHRTACRFTGTALCNLIVRSSMLTSYQIANAGHFSSSPLLPISPLVSREVPFDTAIQVVQRLFVVGSLRLSSVRDALAATERHKDDVDPALVNPFDALVALVRRELSTELAAQLRCETRTEWQPDGEPGRFEEVGYVCMDAGDIARTPIDWLDEFIVTDEGGAVYDRLHREHVSQEYWPRKVVLLEGNKFTVDKVDTATRRIHVTHDEAELPDYRPERVVTINQPTSEWIPLRESQPDLTSQGDGVVIEAFRLDFSVTCGRTVASLDHWASPPQVQSFALPDRRFRSGRAARIRLLDREGKSLLTGSTAVALATWLNEAMPTVMPEASRFFIAAPEVNSESRPTDQTANLVVPVLRIELDVEALPAVWVFEDSQSDLGVIRALSDDLRYLLDLCFDWLNWRFDDTRDPEAGGVCLVNSQALGRDWFAFGCKSTDPAFGLEDLKTTLKRYQELFRWFTPRQRTARGVSLLGDAASAANTACDICAATVTAGAPCDVLADGRISCRACTEVGVTSVAVLERLYREVAQPFYRDSVGETEITNVRVELVDQNDISLAQGKSFIPTSGFDMRAIGLAIPGGPHARSGTREEGGRHLVQIESGFSPEATVCTLVHELCHVWQFNHLDVARLEATHGKELIEGHSVWTEDAFLNWQRTRAHGLFSTERWVSAQRAVDAIKDSAGVYGEGYRILCAQLALSTDSAFKSLRRRFPAK
jgi:hypothetical protein